MGQIKNIKLHIVTDIKRSLSSTKMEDINTRLLDTIDLTGDEPVITTKIVKEIFVSLSDDDDDEHSGEESDEENVEPVVKKVRITMKKCEVCLEEVSKYTCPCCSMRTCSLDCVLDHKQKTGCSGQRDKASFVPRTELNNIHLLNDYRLLEEAARIADNARRDKKSNKPWVEHWVGQFRRHVHKAGITWHCMEWGMKRHKENRSRFNRSKQMIQWTVKLVFVDILKEVSEYCLEDVVLKDVIGNYTDKDKIIPENKITFSAYIERDHDVKVFFRNEFDSGEENLRYTEVDVQKTILDCLYQKSVLEYPEFHIVLCSETAKKLSSELIVKEKDISPRLAPLDTWLEV